jgi:hypothetical protein
LCNPLFATTQEHFKTEQRAKPPAMQKMMVKMTISMEQKVPPKSVVPSRQGASNPLKGLAPREQPQMLKMKNKKPNPEKQLWYLPRVLTMLSRR